MKLADIRAQYPQYKDMDDADLVSAFQRKFYPDMSFEQVAGAMGYEPPGDVSRGVRVGLGQTVPIAKGVVGLIGATAEKTLGEGGIATSVKNWGLQGYEEGMKKLAPLQRDTDELTTAWERAKGGDLGALVDWAQYGLGYAIGQGGEALATSVLGSMAGAALAPEVAPVGAGAGAVTGLVAKGAVKQAAVNMIEGAVAKQAAKIAEESALKAGVKLTAEQVAERAASAEVRQAATREVAKDIGQTTALGAFGVGQELGSIYPEAEAQARQEGRSLSGWDLARVWGTGIAAGGLEALTDKLGVDVALGKTKLGGAGMFGNAGRAAVGGAVVEGATEGLQTAIERVGAGKELTGDDAVKDYINSAGLGAIGGAGLGGVGGLISRQRRVDVEQQRADAEANLGAAQTIDQAIAAADHLATSVADLEAAVGQWNGTGPIPTPAAAAAAPIPAPAAPAAPASGPNIQQLQSRIDREAELLTQRNGEVVGAQPSQLRQQAARLEAQAALFSPEDSAPQGQPGRAQVLIAQAQNLRAQADQIEGRALQPAAGFEFDRQNAQAQIEASRPAPAPRAAENFVDLTPMDPRQAQARLAVLRDETAQAGGNALGLAAVAHPSQPGKFAIVQQPLPSLDLGATPAPAVTPAQAQARIETAALTGQVAQAKAEDQNSRQVVIDRALRSVEERGGVASPAEARIFQEAGLGRPYDRIDTSLAPAPSMDQQLTQATGIALDQAPRSQATQQTGPSEQQLQLEENQARSDSRLQRLAQERAARETAAATDTRTAPGAPAVDDVIAALRTPGTERTAEQNLTLRQAQDRMAPGDFTIAQTAAAGPFNLTTEQRTRLREMRAGTVVSAQQSSAEPVAQATAPRLTGERVARALGLPSNGGIVTTNAKFSTQRAPVPGMTQTVNDDGQEHQFTVVDAGKLGAPGKLLQQVARIFGKRLVVFTSPTLKADGFVRDGDDRNIYVNAQSQVSPLAVFGHELLHILKREAPAAYEALAKVVAAQTQDSPEFRAYYEGYSGDQIPEELAADLMGNRFQDAGFWSDVFAEIAAQNPEGARAVVLKVAAALTRAINSFLQVVRQAGYKADEYVSDLEAIKAAVKEATVTYAQQQREASIALDREDGAAERKPFEYTRELQGNKREMGVPLIGTDERIMASRAQRGGTAEQVGEFNVRTQKDGTLGVAGDVEQIRAMLPDDVKGRAVPGGMVFTTSDAPRVRAALEGRKVAYSRAGQVLDKLPMKNGKYVGAPAKFDTPAKIPTLRKWLRSLADEGAPGRYWYENSGREVLKMVGGDVNEARKFVALLAIYSPQAKVDANSTFALRAWAQYKAGQPISVKTASQDGKATAAMADVDAFWSGEKTGNFFFNLLREIDPSTAGKQGATIDMWMMRAGQYDNDAPTATQYAFMENETNRLAQELGWEPQQVQAAIWVAMKARMENSGVKKRTEASSEKKGWIRYDYPLKNGKPVKTRVILDAKAHRDNWLKHAFAHDPSKQDTAQAKFDFGDGLKRHIGQVSFEARPGRSTGVLPGIHDASYEQQVEFQQAVQAAFLDANGNDTLAQMLGLLVDNGDLLAPGVWQGEVSPSNQKLVAMAPAKGKDGKTKVDPAQARALSAYAAIAGLVARQEGVGWHRPFYAATKREANGLDIDIGRPLTPDETKSLGRAIGQWMENNAPANWQDDFAIISSPKGVRLVTFGAVDNATLQTSVLEVAGSVLPDGDVNWFASSGAMPTNNWKENPNGQAYVERARAEGRPDVLDWARDVLAPRVQRVFEEYSDRYGWGDPGQLRFSKPRDGAGRDSRGSAAPLAGAPTVAGATGPDPRLVEVAERYARDNGIELRRQAEYVDVDPERAARIAAAYEAMPHAPRDPRVKAAYRNLIQQTRAQYDALAAAGYKFYFFDETNDPYQGNPWNAMRDLRANQVMGVFATEAGFGSGATDVNVEDNPLLADTGLEWPYGSLDGEPKRVLANDLFRAVHDAFGHGLEGAGFRARGEENAWQAHVRLLTGSAVGAITSETRGQNSWLNYGPYGEKNQTAAVEDTTFADQKTGLMPEWTWREGRVGDAKLSRSRGEKAADDLRLARQRAWHGSPHRGIDKFSTDKIGSGEGAQAYGWGLYFASLRDIGEYYRRTLQKITYKNGLFGRAAPFDPDKMQSAWARASFRRHGENVDAVLNDLRELLPAGAPVRKDDAQLAADIATLEKIQKKGGLRGRGQLYEVDIPDGSEMLLWDKPVSEQPDIVRQALESNKALIADVAEKNAAREAANARDPNRLNHPVLGKVASQPWTVGRLKGQAAYEAIAAELGSQKAASLYLAGLGVRGIKYLDGTSRSDSEGSHNFVIFDGGDVDIVKTHYSKQRTPLGFYSALADGIDGIKTSAAPAAGWKDAIKGLVNKGAVKADEVQWTGVNEWLDLQQGRVTKEQLAEYLKANGVQVEETVLQDYADDGAAAAVTRALERVAGAGFTVADDGYGPVFSRSTEEEVSFESLPENVQRDIRVVRNQGAGDAGVQNLEPKYGQYGPPGGENYREVLLTLPVKQQEAPKYASYDDMPQADLLAMHEWNDRNGEFRQWSRKALIEHARYEDEESGEPDGLLRHWNNRGASTRVPMGEYGAYKSSHWDQANVLAHLRVDDRTDADGKRVLFIREIQSDWGQDGKKKGFANPAAKGKLAELSKQYDALGAERRAAEKEMAELPEYNARFAELQDRVEQISRDRFKLSDEMDGLRLAANDGATPVAPFVQKTDAWVSLALKRAIVMAAQQGYDKVALINGEQAADMFDLSKQVDQLVVYPDNTLVARQDGRNVLERPFKDESELADIVGKELAAKLLGMQPDMNNQRVLKGQDLRVGGEGMKAFYDNIVPKVAKDVVKKLGGQVSTVSFIRDLIYGDTGLVKQLGFDITPAMREKVEAGVPLFSKQRQTDTPAFKEWFGDSKVVDENGEPKVMYHATHRSFDTFANSFRGALFVTPEPEFANEFIDAKENESDDDNTNIMPLYVKAENPFDYDNPEHVARVIEYLHKTNLFRGVQPGWFEGGRWDAIEDRNVQKAIKALGFDSFYVSEFDTKNLGVYERTQLKSAIGNNGDFDAANPNITKSKQRIVGESKRAYTPEQLAMFKNTGRTVEVPTIKERVASLRKDLGKKLAQGIADQFAPLKDLSREAYALARLSKGAAGAFEAFLHHGRLSIRDNVYDADNTGGFIERLGVPLHGELEDFMWWVAANRAARLKAEGRENLFADADIAAGKSLDQGTTDFDYTIQNGPEKGRVTRDRTKIFRDAQVIFNEFHKNALDMAEQSGLIDGASRATWENEFYVPFYRVSEEEGGFVGAKIGQALVRQRAFKMLKGGSDKLNSDLLANTLQNWGHLIDAAAKNRAAKAALEAASQVGVAIESSEEASRQMAKSMGLKNHRVWFMDQGRERHFVVEDPMVMQAITSLEFAGLRGPLMDSLSKFKHWLTIGVTASPAFKIRNLVRDSLQAVATADLSYNVAGNVVEGFKATNRKSQDYVSMLASGALIRFGTMEGSKADQTRRLIKAGVKDSTILDSEQKVQAFFAKYIEPGITAYNELGNRGEEINRAALYKQLVRQGKSHQEASLMARDLMDFSMQGTFTTIRFLTQVVPFMNARIQGLYKLGKAAKEDPRRFGMVLGATALASIALMAAYADDDDWKKREDWDRNNNWWFKVGGVAFRIPKPFEIGAIATLAERGLEYFTSPEMTGKRLGKNVLDLVKDNLSMNPVPQAVKPIIDIYSNKDSFSGRPIETMGMEKLLPQYRYTQATSMVARGLSAATAGALSPVQYDHILRGYFGWLGSFVVGGADMLVRPLSGEASRPEADYWKMATAGIAQEVDSGSSRYVSQMYDQAKVLEEAYGTYRSLLKQGKGEEAREFLADHRDELVKYRAVERVKQAEAKFNERIRMIERSAMDPAVKKERIREIQREKDRVARLVAPGR